MYKIYKKKNVRLKKCSVRKGSFHSSGYRAQFFSIAGRMLCHLSYGGSTQRCSQNLFTPYVATDKPGTIRKMLEISTARIYCRPEVDGRECFESEKKVKINDSKYINTQYIVAKVNNKITALFRSGPTLRLLFYLVEFAQVNLLNLKFMRVENLAWLLWY